VDADSLDAKDLRPDSWQLLDGVLGLHFFFRFWRCRQGSTIHPPLVVNGRASISRKADGTM